VSILLLGVDHTQAPLALLERLAVPAERTRKVLHELTTLDHVLEAVVVSTCNRIEVYADLARFHDGYDVLVDWLAERGELPRAELEAIMTAKVDEDAAAHLFAVAGGLDSMVVGEQQIAMQVRDAMEEARAEGTAGRMLQRLFRQAVRVGRRVRRETTIGESARSMVDVGLEAVADHLAGWYRRA
jgi:glutamyl-tRNA reductase